MITTAAEAGMGEEVDQHLFSVGRKRVLCLDGGGIRGLTTIGVLERVEEMLRERRPQSKRADFVLSDYFDLIAGTSTGAIIAGMLALGWSVKRVQDKYEDLGPLVFSNPRAGGQVLQAKFDGKTFEDELKDTYRETSLGSKQLRTGLLITCHRMDNGSAWLLCNNKKGAFWRYDEPRLIRQLVRASAAAPTYFDPVVLPIGDGDDGLFLDGAMSGLNNPSLATLLYVLADEYNLRWRSGQDELYMLSVGTGFKRYTHLVEDFKGKVSSLQARDALAGLIHQSSFQAVMTMQALSHSTEPFILNSEVQGLMNTQIAGRPLLHFERMDPPLDDEQLRGLGMFLPDHELKALEHMDVCTHRNVTNLRMLGQRYGAHISEARLPAAFDI